jgi:Ribonuclease G/E
MVRYVGKLSGKKIGVPCPMCKGSGHVLKDELVAEPVEDTPASGQYE